MSEKEFNKIFGKNLQFYLDSKQISQTELANYLKVSPTSVNNWCRGLKTPRMDKVDKICNFFHINRSDLLNEHNDEQPQGYYLDSETAEFAQELKDRPELKILFSASRKATKEDIEMTIDILNRLTGGQK